MKILQVIPRFNPKHGGGVDVVYNVSKFLSRRGHEVTILTTDYEFSDSFANTIRNEGVEVIPFKSIFNFCLFIPSPNMNKWIAKNIKNYDIIHLNGARSYQNNVVCKYAIKHNIPYVLQAHGSILRIVSRKAIKTAYDVCWGYNIFKNVSKCIALTESEKEAYEIAGIDGSKVEIIPNGVDVSKFSDLPDKGCFRRKYSLGSDKLVLYLGRLHKSKGIDLIPPMFHELTTKLDNSRLIFVGPDDGYAHTVKKKIDFLNLMDKTLFTGLVSEEEKLMALVDCDVFVTPRFYGFPIAFLEAWACGLPVITTNEGDSLPWINNRVGYVVDYNKEELCNAVVNILTDQEKKQKFSNNAKLMIQEKLNWESIVKRIENVYKDISS
jgi:glycosyltransferase involved in cell wall biosynthesis